MMTTADMSCLRSNFNVIAKRYLENPDEFADNLPSLFQVTHRDMGPRSRYLGPEVPRGADLARSCAARRP
jgi:catalase-peroxidase